MCDDEEELFRYHFGDMTEVELAQFEHRLSNESDLAERLKKLVDCLNASEASDCDKSSASSTDVHIDAPAGLADRVTDSVADLRLEDLHRTPPTDVTPSQPCRFSLFDAGAAISALLLIALIVSPSILKSREDSRLIQCQDNLATLGQALKQYALDHNNQFPHLKPYENAGMFTITLAEANYLQSDEIQELVVCPASQLADEITNRHAMVWVPTRYEFQTTPALLAERAKQFMSGSYAYRIGYFDEGEYVPIKITDSKCEGDRRSPMLCDAPSPSCMQNISPHHVNGQNILFQDGSVDFQTSCQSSCRRDHFFLNNDGEVAAGKSWQDAVLVRSEVTPWPFSTVSFQR